MTHHPMTAEEIQRAIARAREERSRALGALLASLVHRLVELLRPRHTSSIKGRPAGFHG